MFYLYLTFKRVRNFDSGILYKSSFYYHSRIRLW